MIELFEAAFSGVNIVYTILLIVLLVYWCIVILGIFDFNAFDLDVDAGVDLDVDADMDAGIEGMEGGFSWLAFFNIGEVPIMLYATIVAITMWVISLQMNYLLDQYAHGWVNDYHGWIAVGMSVPILIFALLLAKVIVFPVKKLHQRLPQATKLDGKVCRVTSSQIDENYGRCELPKRDSSLILNARTRPGEVLKKGDPAEIVEHVINEDAKEDYYIVTKWHNHNL